MKICSKEKIMNNALFKYKTLESFLKEIQKLDKQQ